MTSVLTTFPQDDPLAFRVRNFTALVEEVGRLFAEVQHADVLFRGQACAHVHPDSRHSLRPRLYRHGPVPPHDLKQFLRHVRQVNEALLLNPTYARPQTGVEALFAHYERFDTRMLDVTHVLHVAASFALARHGGDSEQLSVVYALDVSGGRPRPARGQLGRALVASTTLGAANRPARQAAWVMWQHDAGCEPVDFGDRVLKAFFICPEDMLRFWDCQAALDYAWLMCGDDMADAMRRM